MAAAQDIAAALRRVDTVLRRRPETGLHEDSLATARWEGGLRVVASHANGTRVATDQPAEFGGTGDRVTAGWLMRAGVASCTATCIAMWAAAEGIELDALEVQVKSHSDARGMLGIDEPDGRPVGPGPRVLKMHVTLAARGVPAERLHALVDKANALSPISAALRTPVPIETSVAIDAP